MMLVSILLRDTLSSLVNDRVYPHPASENNSKVLPYITYQEISGTALTTLDEYTEHDRFRVQVNIYCASVIDAGRLAIAVKSAVFNQSICAAEIAGDRADSDTASNTWSKHIDFMIWQSGCDQ